MKTTIELSDNLLLRAKQRAKEESVTLRELIEKALATELNEIPPKQEIKAVTYKGKGLSPEFENASWDQIRDAIYS